MGKSTLIDALTSLSLAQIAQLSPATSTAEFHQAMSDSICVTIDYNGYQPVMDLDLVYPVAGAGFRILHSYVSLRLALMLRRTRLAYAVKELICLFPCSLSNIRYFCSERCSLHNFVGEMKSIIQVENFYSFSPEDAIRLIRHHHRVHIVKDENLNPLVIVFVDEARTLAEVCTRRQRSQSPIEFKTHLDALISQENSIRDCWQLNEMLTAIGSCLSRVPEFYTVITSLENSSLLAVCAFRCHVCVTLIIFVVGSDGLIWFTFAPASNVCNVDAICSYRNE